MQFGLGGVGRALLRQILDTRDRLAARRGLHLRYVGLVDTRGLAWNDTGLNDLLLAQALAVKDRGDSLVDFSAGEPRPTELEVLDRLERSGRRAILVDVTAAGVLEDVIQLAGEGCENRAGGTRA